MCFIIFVTCNAPILLRIRFQTRRYFRIEAKFLRIFIAWCGHFTIVLNVSENQIKTWQGAEPKEYKIRVLDPDHPTMAEYIKEDERTWRELDNCKLVFKSDFTPRARYLYFAHCETLLRPSFAGKHLEVARAELRKKFWGHRCLFS